jgi:hypothetical protein
MYFDVSNSKEALELLTKAGYKHSKLNLYQSTDRIRVYLPEREYRYVVTVSKNYTIPVSFLPEALLLLELGLSTTEVMIRSEYK